MPLPNLDFHTVNAFAPTPHGGNQAAVVLIPSDDPRATDEKYMQTIATDFNLSETAFLVHHADSPVPTYGLRWFTPEAEVVLCGHATLASATVLFNHIHPDAAELAFKTRWSGTLGARRESDKGQGVTIGLTLPVAPSTLSATSPHKGAIAAACGIAESDIVQIADWVFGKPSVIVQVKESVAIGELTVDARKLPDSVFVTVITNVSKSEKENTVRADDRVFAPALGVDEDPVTGSAWAAVTGYYLSGAGRESVAALLPGKDVENARIDAHQLSKRGGALTCELRDGKAYVAGRGWRTGFGQLESFE